MGRGAAASADQSMASQASLTSSGPAAGADSFMGGMPSGGPELSEAYEEGMKVIESHAVMLKEKTAQFGPGAPETIAARCTCAQECNKLGIELLQRSEHETTLKLLQQALSLVKEQRGVDMAPGLVADVANARACTLNNLACVYRQQQKLQPALKCLMTALSLETDLITDSGASSASRRDAAGTHLNLSAVLSQLHRHADAASHSTAAARILSGVLAELSDLHLLSLDSTTERGRSEGDQSQAIMDVALALIMAHHNLGAENEYLRRFEKSLHHYGRAVGLGAAHLPPTHPMVQKAARSAADFSARYFKATEYERQPLYSDEAVSRAQDVGGTKGRVVKGAFLKKNASQPSLLPSQLQQTHQQVPQGEDGADDGLGDIRGLLDSAVDSSLSHTGGGGDHADETTGTEGGGGEGQRQQQQQAKKTAGKRGLVKGGGKKSSSKANAAGSGGRPMAGMGMSQSQSMQSLHTAPGSEGGQGSSAAGGGYNTTAVPSPYTSTQQLVHHRDPFHASTAALRPLSGDVLSRISQAASAGYTAGALHHSASAGSVSMSAGGSMMGAGGGGSLSQHRRPHRVQPMGGGGAADVSAEEVDALAAHQVSRSLLDAGPGGYAGYEGVPFSDDHSLSFQSETFQSEGAEGSQRPEGLVGPSVLSGLRGGVGQSTSEASFLANHSFTYSEESALNAAYATGGAGGGRLPTPVAGTHMKHAHPHLAAKRGGGAKGFSYASLDSPGGHFAGPLSPKGSGMQGGGSTSAAAQGLMFGNSFVAGQGQGGSVLQYGSSSRMDTVGALPPRMLTPSVTSMKKTTYNAPSDGVLGWNSSQRTGPPDIAINPFTHNTQDVTSMTPAGMAANKKGFWGLHGGAVQKATAQAGPHPHDYGQMTAGQRKAAAKKRARAEGGAFGGSGGSGAASEGVVFRSGAMFSGEGVDRVDGPARFAGKTQLDPDSKVGEIASKILRDTDAMVEGFKASRGGGGSGASVGESPSVAASSVGGGGGTHYGSGSGSVVGGGGVGSGLSAPASHQSLFERRGQNKSVSMLAMLTPRGVTASIREGSGGSSGDGQAGGLDAGDGGGVDASFSVISAQGGGAGSHASAVKPRPGGGQEYLWVASNSPPERHHGHDGDGVEGGLDAIGSLIDGAVSAALDLEEEEEDDEEDDGIYSDDNEDEVKGDVSSRVAFASGDVSGDADAAQRMMMQPGGPVPRAAAGGGMAAKQQQQQGGAYYGRIMSRVSGKGTSPPQQYGPRHSTLRALRFRTLDFSEYNIHTDRDDYAEHNGHAAMLQDYEHGSMHHYGGLGYGDLLDDGTEFLDGAFGADGSSRERHVVGHRAILMEREAARRQRWGDAEQGSVDANRKWRGVGPVPSGSGKKGGGGGGGGGAGRSSGYDGEGDVSRDRDSSVGGGSVSGGGVAESSSLGESGVRTRIMAKDDLVNRRLAEKEDAHTAAFLKEEGDAAKRIQASFRGHKDRRDIVASRRAEVQEAFDRDCKEQDEAAVRLQGSFRGYRTRKANPVGARKAEIEDMRSSMALIQEACQEKLEQDAAATAIQSRFKGHRHRVVVKEKAEQSAAATAIQSRYRTHAVQAERREQALAAGKIQTRYKKHAEAKHQNQAASVLQKRMRGMQGRSRFKDRNEAHAKDQEAWEVLQLLLAEHVYTDALLTETEIGSVMGLQVKECMSRGRVIPHDLKVKLLATYRARKALERHAEAEAAGLAATIMTHAEQQEALQLIAQASMTDGQKVELHKKMLADEAKKEKAKDKARAEQKAQDKKSLMNERLGLGRMQAEMDIERDAEANAELQTILDNRKKAAAAGGR